MSKLLKFIALLCISFTAVGVRASATPCNSDPVQAYANEAITFRVTQPVHNYWNMGPSKMYLDNELIYPKAGVATVNNFYTHTFPTAGSFDLKIEIDKKFGNLAHFVGECTKKITVLKRKVPKLEVIKQSHKYWVNKDENISITFSAAHADRIILTTKRYEEKEWRALKTCHASTCEGKINAEGFTTHAISAIAYNGAQNSYPVTYNWSSRGRNVSPSVSISANSNLVNNGTSTDITITASDKNVNPAHHISQVEFLGADGKWVSKTPQCIGNSGKKKTVSCKVNSGNLSKAAGFKARVKDSGLWVTSNEQWVGINNAPKINSLSIKSGNKESRFFTTSSDVSVSTTATDSNGNIARIQICGAKGTNNVDPNKACSAGEWVSCSSSPCSKSRKLTSAGAYTIYSRVEDKLGLKGFAPPQTIHVLSDFGIYVDQNSVARQYIVNDKNNPPEISWTIVANKVYSSGRKVKGFRIVPNGNAAHAITPNVPELAGGPVSIGEACIDGRCRFTLKWKPDSDAVFGSPIHFYVQVIDDQNAVQQSDTIQTTIALAKPPVPPTPVVSLNLNSSLNRYEIDVSKYGNASRFSIEVNKAGVKSTYATTTRGLPWGVPGTSVDDNGSTLSVCVVGIADGPNGFSTSKIKGCASKTIDHNDTPQRPLFNMSHSQFGGDYTMRWQSSQDKGLTKYYNLKRWNGHIAATSQAANAIYSNIQDTAFPITDTPMGTYTYILEACNRFNECKQSSPFVVEHIAPMAASASVSEDSKKLILGGAGFALSGGRLIAQIENTSETYEIEQSDITVNQSGGVLTANLTERLYKGYENKGLIVEYRNQVSCPVDDNDINIIGKVLCVDGLSTYKVRVDDQAPDEVLDMTENNFTVSSSGYVYVGASQPGSDKGAAPFYQVGASSETITGLHIYKHGTQNSGWIFKTDDANANSDDRIVGKPLVLNQGGVEHVYFGAQNHSVYKITHNPSSISDNRFSYIWKQTTGGANTAGVQTDMYGNIYVGSMDQKLYSLLPDSGQINWHYSFAPSGGVVSLTGVGADGLVSVTTQDGEINHIDRNLVDKKAVSWTRLDDYQNLENPGWQPPVDYLEGNIISHLLAVIHNRLPSKREIAALSFAHMHGHSLEEVVNAILNAPVGTDQQALALRGPDNLAFANALMSRLLNSEVSTSTTLLGKTASQWAAELESGKLRRAELVILLQQPTYTYYQDTVNELMDIYFGYCFGSQCNYSRDTDNDGILNIIELALGLNVNDPRDGLRAPQMTLQKREGGNLTFALSSLDNIDYYKVFHIVNSSPEVETRLDASGSAVPYETVWSKVVTNADHVFYAKSCLETLIENKKYESCSVSASSNESITVEDSSSESAINVVLSTKPATKDTSQVELMKNAEMTPTLGSFRVSEAGSATYSIPIQLPSGIAGVTPSVSMSYNSQAGDSSIAVGWSLNVGSAITRCRATLATDGYSRSVGFNDSDKYCLDGQRLIKVENPYVSPVLPYQGSGNATYVLEHDAQVIVKDVTVLGARQFVVFGKDGSKKIYGGHSSRIVKVGGGDYNPTLTWLLHKEYDSTQSDESAVTYSYTTKASNGDALGDGELVLEKIDYSTYRVKFDYSAGKTRNLTYINHGTLSQRARLDKITVQKVGASPVELSHYKIAANTSEPSGNGLRRLDKFQQCRGGICKKPIVFDYADFATPHYFEKNTELFVAKDKNKLAAFTFIDTQGDGFAELATLERLHGQDKKYELCLWPSQPNDNQSALDCWTLSREDDSDSVSMMAIDPEGDGSQTLWINKKSYFEESYSGFYWLAFGFDGEKLTFGYPEISNLRGNFMREIKSADFDGDGYLDIAYKKQFDDATVYISYWNGTSYSNESKVDFSYGEIGTVSDWRATDINFDGLADIISLSCWSGSCDEPNPGRLFAFINQGSNTSFQSHPIYGSENGKLEHLTITDINSDGLVDFILLDSASNGTKAWKVLTSRTSSIYAYNIVPQYQATVFELNDTEDTSLNLQDASLDENATPFVLDVDKNGINEVYFKQKGATDYWNKFQWDTDKGSLRLQAERVRTFNLDRDAKSLVFPADFDNNGFVDLVQKDGDRLVARFGSNQPAHAGLLRSIKQGYGNETRIEYRAMNTLGKDAIYSKSLEDLPSELRDTTEDSKQFDAQGFKVSNLVSAMPLVASVETDTSVSSAQGEDKPLTVSYRYYGAKAQFGGRGTLGFAAIRTTTEKDQKHFITTTRYRQAFPYTGLPAATHKSIGERLISLAVNKYARAEGKHSNSYYIFTEKSRDCSARIDSVDAVASYSVSGYSCTNTTIDEDVWGNVFTMDVTQYDVLFHNVEEFAYYGYLSDGTELASTNTTNCYGEACNKEYAYAKPYVRLGRLTSTTVTQTELNKDSVTKTNKFTYYDSGIEKFLLKDEVVNEGAGCDKELTTSYTYDEVGNIETVALTNTGCSSEQQQTRLTTHVYDEQLHLKSSSNNYFTPSVVKSWNDFGQPLIVEHIDDLQIHMLYDTFGAKIGSFSTDGAQSYTYLTDCDANDTQCAVQQNTLFNGYIVEKSYMDKGGRVYESHKRGMHDHFWFKTEVEHDRFGRAISHKGPGQEAVTTVYDAFDRVVSVTDPNAGTITTHKQQGLVSTVTMESTGLQIEGTANRDKGLPGGNSQTQSVETDLLGRNYKVTDNAGNVLTYEYDIWGNNTTVHSSADNQIVLQNTYEADGRLLSRKTLNNGEWSYKFNAFGQVREQTDARGVTSTIKYDLIGRKISQSQTSSDNKVVLEGDSEWSYIEYDEAATQPTHQLQYAKQGNWLQHYFYDKRGRLASTLTDLESNQCYSGVVFNSSNSDLNISDDKLLDPVSSLCVIQQKFYDQYGRDAYQFEDYRRNQDGYFYDVRGIKKIYHKFGMVIGLQEARDTENGIRYYNVDTAAVNKRGQVTSYDKGLVKMSLMYDSQGMIAGIDAKYRDKALYLQGDRYRFDSLGNLTYRSLLNGSGEQKFGYDGLNRVSAVNGVTDFEYCDNGSLKKKGKWTYHYGANQCDSHRLEKRTRNIRDFNTNIEPFNGLTAAGNNTAPELTPASHAAIDPQILGHIEETFDYDNNGNELWMKRDNKAYRSQTYSGRNKVKSIKGIKDEISFDYDVNNRRYKRVDDNQTVYYVGALELTKRNVGSIEEKFIRRYIGNEAVQIYYVEGGSSLQWMFTDHQGSITAVADSNYNLLARYQYDVFGKRSKVAKNKADEQYYAAHLSISLFNEIAPNLRSYTGHEPVSLDGDNRVIHMNGRIYDADTGRFMQADPFIQAPQNLQNYNAYSYVLNNPLSFTDPSGYLFKKMLKGAMKATGTWDLMQQIAANPVLNSVIQVVMIFIPGCQSGACHAVFNAATTFAATGSLNAGIKAGAISYAQSAALQKIGASKTWGQPGSIENIAANALVGGVASELQGGKFGHGFIAAGVASTFKPMLNNIGGAQSANSAIKTGNIEMLAKFKVHRIIGAAVIGGTTSMITGGKFANGAITAAFTQAFNGESRNEADAIEKNFGNLRDKISEANYKTEEGRITIATAKNMLTKGGISRSQFDRILRQKSHARLLQRALVTDLTKLIASDAIPQILKAADPTSDSSQRALVADVVSSATSSFTIGKLAGGYSSYLNINTMWDVQNVRNNFYMNTEAFDMMFDDERYLLLGKYRGF
ncbi:hypothetical protein N474_17135 [Pseudoalteromonas luteoviolacea CPMOR-2]|uniref:RHS repeat-associated core domain-containing protein n=1 Tax=Pseudoalteromonas luteoviolacea TaxID=43657 RepID=UPI0007B038BC|nr:RHS repeat-associated core domain-containing protein [Pseudoalteromonas luteoviolacea]KZN54926.1 hypothetical protein N474_17135 [Pseudoalteromonas luteoviolacea CPMOR-2]